MLCVAGLISNDFKGESMSYRLNIKLKDGVEPSVLLNYGFVPKYDEDTGEIKEYIKKIYIGGKAPHEHHFTFVLYTKHTLGGLLKRIFYYEAWMTGFQWDCLCHQEAMQLVYDLIKDGIVEPAEEVIKSQ